MQIRCEETNFPKSRAQQMTFGPAYLPLNDANDNIPALRRNANFGLFFAEIWLLLRFIQDEGEITCLLPFSRCIKNNNESHFPRSVHTKLQSREVKLSIGKKNGKTSIRQMNAELFPLFFLFCFARCFGEAPLRMDGNCCRRYEHSV